MRTYIGKGSLGKPQKRGFFSGPATKRGEGEGRATKKKNYFFWSSENKSEKMWPLSSSNFRKNPIR